MCGPNVNNNVQYACAHGPTQAPYTTNVNNMKALLALNF